MSHKKLVHSLAFALSILLTCSAHAEKTSTIKKCKDATGRWHYGDSAAEECAKSKITVLSEEGTTKKVIAAPPTEAELKDRELKKEETEREQQKSQDQAKKDALLLSTYGGENDINYIRDRKIAQIETAVKSSEETLKTLRAALKRMEIQAADESKKNDKSDVASTTKNIEQTQAQIVRHEGVIAEKRKEQDAIRTQYAAELQRYRELKNQSSKVTAPKTAP